MRISDWSSDVCSSDLRRVLIDAVVQTKPVVCLVPFFILAISVAPPHICRARRSGLIDPLKPCRVIAIVLFPVAALLQIGVAVEGIEQCNQAGNLVFNSLAVGESMAEFRMRSEEHTSELQSLMRISYAVFCLKKKNKPRT